MCACLSRFDLVITIETKLLGCLFIKLGRNSHYDKRMNPIDFGGQRSKVKVTIDICGNKLVNKIDQYSQQIRRVLPGAQQEGRKET